MKRILLVLLLILPLLSRAQTASFTVSTDTVCQDSVITFINTSTGPIDSIRWVVSGHGLTNPHSHTITVCFLSAGYDTVDLYVYDTGRVDTAIKVVSIKHMPHPMLIDTLPDYGGFPCGLYVPDVYASYKWYFANVSTFTNGDTTNYTPSTYSSFAFVVVDSNGCYGRSDTVGLCVEEIKTINNQNTKINLFPNPATDQLTITTNNPIRAISITDVLGQSVFTSRYNSDNLQVNVADLPSGIFLIKINGSEVRKFVKE